MADDATCGGARRRADEGSLASAGSGGLRAVRKCERNGGECDEIGCSFHLSSRNGEKSASPVDGARKNGVEKFMGN